MACGFFCAPARAASTPKTPPRHVAAKHTPAKRRGKRSRKTSANWRKHGQQKIDPQRAHDIQEALIRSHYMSGSPTGKWDDTSQKAMEKFQADNGWQHKTIPDSRALIKLGLGPDHQHLLNPESAMTTSPLEAHSPSATPPAEGAAPTSGTNSPSQN